MAITFDSSLGKPHANPRGGNGKAGGMHPGRREAGRAAYLADREARRKPAYTRDGRMYNNPKREQAKAHADFDAMGDEEAMQWVDRAEGVRDYNNTPAGGGVASPSAGVPVAQMLQPAPKTPEADKGNTFAAKVDAAGGAGAGEKATPVAGGSFSAVKPAGGFTSGMGATARDKVAGRPNVPVGIRQQIFGERELAAKGIGKQVANVGVGQTLGGVMDAPTVEGKLTNPGRDMVAGMNVQRPDGGVLSFTRPDAGQGGPAPLRLTGATRAAGTSIAMNDGSRTGADVRVSRGGGRTDIYDLGAQLGGTGAYRGSVTDKGGGLRTVQDKTGRTVGRATDMNTPEMAAAKKTGNVAAVEKATVAARDRQRMIVKQQQDQPMAKAA